MTHEPQPTPALEAAARRRRELRDALVAFEDAISSPVRDRETWRGEVTGDLEALRQAFDDHVAETEHAGGLYDEMEQIAPHLAARPAGFARSIPRSPRPWPTGRRGWRARSLPPRTSTPCATTSSG